MVEEEESHRGGRGTPTPAPGLSREARRPGPLCSSLRWPESPPPAREGQMLGFLSPVLLTVLSHGSQRLMRLEFAVWPLPDSPRHQPGEEVL